MGLKTEFNDAKKRHFYAQMHELLRAGLSFSASFTLIVESAEGPDKELFQNILDRVIAGDSLWGALSEQEPFTRLDYGVIRIGEESGKLTEALSFLTDYYEKRESQKRSLIGAISYPAITLSVAIIVLVFMMLVVVPMFEQVYARMGGELPSLTRAVMNLSAKMPIILVVIFVLLSALLLLRHLYGKTEYYQDIKAIILFKIPILGGFLKKVELSRFTRIMYLLVSSEVPILQSLELISEIMQYMPYRRAMTKAIAEVESGMLLYAALSKNPELFDKKTLVLLKVGEETASLDNMLKSLSVDISEELNYKIKQLNNTLEPVMILVIGIIVAFVLISMYLPMFKLGMTIQ